MNTSDEWNGGAIPWERYVRLLVVAWIALFVALVGWNLVRHRSDLLELARHEARIAYEKDVLVRHWASEHGGVYVPISTNTPPNPYLTNVVDREITTPSGKRLTLMNPAYLTRQLHEIQQGNHGVRGHITSLKPLRPENAPDAWEADALRAFERGRAEVSMVERIEGREFLRLMRPLRTEGSCLRCHAAQGYKLGEIRGGISVAVPMEPLQAAGRRQLLRLGIGGSLIWLVGLGLIGLGSTRLKRQTLRRAAAEAALRQADERLQLHIRKTPVAVVEWDTAFRVVGWNPAAERLFGYPAAEALGRHASFIVPPKGQAAAGLPWSGPLVADQETARTNENLTKAGQVILCEWFNTSLTNAAGQPIGVASLVQDVTERRRAEEALSRSEARLKEAQQIAQMGSWEKDLSTGTLIWSEEVHRICDTDPARFPVSSEAFLELVHPDDREGVRRAFAESIRNRTGYDTVHRLRLADGRVKFVHERAQLYCDAAGNPLRSVGTLQDITERKQAEEAVRQSEQKFRCLFEEARDAILLLDEAGRFADCNEATLRLLGATAKQQVVGHTPTEFSPALQPDGQASNLKAAAQVRAAFAQGSVSFEWTHCRLDGTEVVVEVSLSAVSLDGRRVLLVHWRDVTERSHAARERERLIRELQQTLAEVKTLSGLLPICSGCKKIRDDQGYWTQLEHYFHQRSGAQFTHGLCPDCIRKYFPGIEA